MYNIKLETSSEYKLLDECKELINYLNMQKSKYSISEDDIALGSDEDFFLLGIVFIINSALSGATWDLIKNQIKSIGNTFSNKQKENVSVYLEIDNGKKKKRINISTSVDDSDLEITVPNEIKILIKKNK